MSRVEVRIEGRVQGVGFRYFIMRNAEKMGLSGYVKNMPDGTVEIDAEGPEDKLKQLVQAAKKGPSAARVSNVNAEWREKEKGYDSFSLKW